MHEVNRSVFLLVPLQPFWSWLQNLPDLQFDKLTLSDLQEDANAYLIPVCESADEIWSVIESRYQQIFAAELADWCEDETLWPELNSETFTEWFDVQLASVVTDLAEENLMRETFSPLRLN